MGNQNPTVIVGHLDTKELEKSIDDIVKRVGDSTQEMATKFEKSMDIMKSAMSDFAVMQKVSAQTIKESWKDITASFDAMLKAQNAATRSSGSRSGAVTTTGDGSATSTSASSANYDPNTVGWLEQIIALEQKRRKEIELTDAALKKQNDDIAQLKNLLQKATESSYSQRLRTTFGMSAMDLSSAEQKLAHLRSLQQEFGNGTKLSVTQQNRLNKAIEQTEKQIATLKSKAPKTLKDVLGMDESSLDAITRKMQALKQVQIDPKNEQQVKELAKAYQDLKKQQNDMMGQNNRVVESNFALARSFNYIRNRLVYALTIGAITNFVKQVYEIRGQYELLERSLGVLVNSFEKGSQIFRELNEMALKSPFTLIELGTAAKQLTAYNFAANEVVDTTRRLADISAALGVPMERLVYNLGQIKAQGALTARDARDFANAGLAIVPMLAQMYTEQKRFGDEMVTTAKVYDMMSKKLVTYNDVLSVLYKVTDEGGKFFDFQAKQAETLKVQMNNLTLAINNMYNEIGASNQGFLVSTVKTTKYIFQNWKQVANIIQSLIVTYGTYKTILAVVHAAHLRTFGARLIVDVKNYITAIRTATGAMATFNAVMSSNVIVLFTSALAGLASYFLFFKDNVKVASAEVEQFGENGAKALKKIRTLKTILEGTEQTSSVYKSTLKELASITQEYGVALDAETAKREQVNGAIENTIELIKTESAERQRANELQRALETYESGEKTARDKLSKDLEDARIAYTNGSRALAQDIIDNSEAISAIISSMVSENASLLMNRTGKELDDAIDELQKRITTRLNKLGFKIDTSRLVSGSFGGNIVRSYATNIAQLNTQLDKTTNLVEKNYKAAKDATKNTMTFTEKVNANARALRHASQDAVSLYNNVYEIVKLAQQNHVINFDLKLTAQQPPKWMMNKDLGELQKLAERFISVAKSGGKIQGYTNEQTYERGLQYAAAARQKQIEEERKAQEKADKKHANAKKDVLGEALQKEVEIVSNLTKKYKEYWAMGVDSTEAINKTAQEYNNTLNNVNNTLAKFGITQTKSVKELANLGLQDIKAYYESLLVFAKQKGNTKGIEAIEKAIDNLNTEITKQDYKTYADSLNSELSKIKDEYELSLDLEANPELGQSFMDLMGIVPEQLPRTLKQYADRLVFALNEYIKKANVNLPEFTSLNLTDDDLRYYENLVEKQELTKVAYDEIVKAVKMYREAAKKEFDTDINNWNKLIEKYGQLEAKIQKIQNDAAQERLDFIRQFGSESQKEIAVKLVPDLKKETDPQIRQGLIDDLKALTTEVAGTDAARIDVKIAIDDSEVDKISEETFKEFQKTPEWMLALGDLSGLTHKALGTLIKDIRAFASANKNLSDKDLRKIAKTIKQLQEAQRKDNPFLAIKDAIENARERVKPFEKELEGLKKELKSYQEQAKKAGLDQSVWASKVVETQKKIKKTEEKLKKFGKLSANEFIEALNKIKAPIDTIIGSIGDMFAAFGNEDASEALKTLSSVVDKAMQFAQIGGMIGGVWGAAIGGILGGLMGLFTSLADIISGNAAITEKVEESERAVKRLENSYKDLEVAIEKAFGAAQMGAKNVAIANKRLQLSELQRQLALERSRKSKYRDEDKIIELIGEIKDLKNEITDMVDDIVNSFMGISSVSDAVSDMVGTLIDSLRNGEDAMSNFNESINDMIANMIKQVVMAEIVGPKFQAIWDAIERQILGRVENVSTLGYENARTFYDEFLNQMEARLSQHWVGDKENFIKMIQSLQNIDSFFDTNKPEDVLELQYLKAYIANIRAMMEGQYTGSLNKELEEIGNFLSDKVGLGSNAIKNWAEYAAKAVALLRGTTINTYDEWETWINEYLKAQENVIENASTPTMDDIRAYAEGLRGISPEIEGYIDNLQSILQEMGLINDTAKDKSLSLLQQGIQGITEDTAGALEGYLSIVSQRMFYHSTLLEEIRDKITTFDFSVQLGTLSQMLLQMQQSYQTQQAIQNILEGTLTPSGRAFMVELNS